MRPNIVKEFWVVKGFLSLSFVGRDPIAQSAGQMERGEGVDAFPGAAIHEIQVQVGTPERIADFVKFDAAAVGNNGGLRGKLGAKPGDVLVAPVQACLAHGSEVCPGPGVVDHQGNLVAAFAFVGLRKCVKVVAEFVSGAGVVFGKFYSVGTVVVNGVFDVAAAFDFPAAIDVPTGGKRKGGQKGRCS